MESGNAHNRLAGGPLEDDVRLVLVQMVVPLLQDLRALLDVLDIVDGYLNEHVKTSAQWCGVHCTRVCAGHKSM